MSVLNNIQGTLTQTQQPSQVQQQMHDQPRQAQLAGLDQGRQEAEQRANSVSQRDETTFAEVGKDGGEPGQQKHKKRKPTLGAPVADDGHGPSPLSGGSLFDSRA